MFVSSFQPISNAHAPEKKPELKENKAKELFCDLSKPEFKKYALESHIIKVVDKQVLEVPNKLYSFIIQIRT